MADPFDPYREALVVEEETVWSAAAGALAIGWDRAKRARVERRLHADPRQATELHYVRVPTGFGRRLVVHPADLERLRSNADTSA